MRRCFLFAAGDFDGLRETPDRAGDFVIAADAGYRLCRELGITPDLIIGDFDSMEEPSFPRDADGGKRPDIRRVPVEKDDTDTMLAIKAGLDAGCDAFYLYGCTGGRRLDHTLANLQGLLYLRRHGARGFLYGGGFVWTALENESLTIPRAVEWGLLSLFALDGKAEGVTVSGVQYPLAGGVLTAEFPLGVSNHITGERAVVAVERGALLAGWELPPA